METTPQENKYVSYYTEDPSPQTDLGYRGKGWYFWDEIQTYMYGPYKSFAEASEELHEYHIWLESR